MTTRETISVGEIELPIYDTQEVQIAHSRDEILATALSGVTSFVRRARLICPERFRLDKALQLADLALSHAAIELDVMVPRHSWGLERISTQHPGLRPHHKLPPGYALVVQVDNVQPIVAFDSHDRETLQQRSYTYNDHTLEVFPGVPRLSDVHVDQFVRKDREDLRQYWLVDIDPKFTVAQY